MPPVAFDPADCAAQVFARAGVAMVRRGANALATLPSGAQVAGIFRRGVGIAQVGIGVRASDVDLRIVTADLAEPLTIGAELSIVHGGSTSRWAVVDPISYPEHGHTLVLLEAA